MKTFTHLLVFSFLLSFNLIQGATINLAPKSNKSGAIDYSLNYSTRYLVYTNSYNGIGKLGGGGATRRLFFYFDLSSVKNFTITSCKMNLSNLRTIGDGGEKIYVTDLGEYYLPLSGSQEAWSQISKSKVVSTSPTIHMWTSSVSIDLTNAVKKAISQNKNYIELGFYYSNSEDGAYCNFSNLIIDYQTNPPQTPTFTTSRNGNTVTLNMFSRNASYYNIEYTDYSSSTNWTRINNIPSQSYTLNLDETKSYIFKVQAVNSYGVSSWSNLQFDYNTYYNNISISNFSVKSLGDNWFINNYFGDDYAFKINISSTSWVNINGAINESSTGFQIFDVNGNPLTNIETIRNTWACPTPDYSMKTILTPGEYFIVLDKGSLGGNNSLTLTLNTIPMPVFNIPFRLHGSTEYPYNFWNTDGLDGSDKTYLVYLDHPDQVFFNTNFGDAETNFNTILQVFKLDYLSTGIYGDDQNGSQAASVNGSLSAGYYLVVVDGFMEETGNFLLSVTDWYSSEYSEYYNYYNDYSFNGIFGSGLKSGNINSKYNQTFKELQEYKEDQFIPSVEIKCFPNPARNELNLVFSELISTTNAWIFNSRGEKVKEIVITKPNTKINCEGFDSGLYFLKIKIKEKLHIIKFNIVK